MGPANARAAPRPAACHRCGPPGRGQAAADQAAAMRCGTCIQGTSNFSNTNFTLQARLYSKALRDYPSPYITPQMERQLIEWQAWSEDIGGNNRFPDNNEFYVNWNPANHTFVRSSINDDTLGSFSWLMFQDIAGLQPRADAAAELWPVDMGYHHFTVNDVSYHGAGLKEIQVFNYHGGR